nr:hypothetical protein HK105_005836 [Polyrhizophydium stewartii]
MQAPAQPLFQQAAGQRAAAGDTSDDGGGSSASGRTGSPTRLRRRTAGTRSGGNDFNDDLNGGGSAKLVRTRLPRGALRTSGRTARGGGEGGDESDAAHARDAWHYEFHDPVDPTVAFFYRPHNITALLLFLGAVIYFAMFKSTGDFATNVKLGLSASVFVLLLIGMLQFRDGPFIRPHPAIWRIVLAAGVAYQLVLVVLLFQTKSDARAILKFFDPSLGVPLPEKNYAEDCSLTWQTLYDQMDVFVIAHSVGWFCKALVLRDYWFCWIISILFEFMEYSLAHQLPNFAECWWDHWILDVLTTNWLGTYLGMKACEYFEFKHYSWRGIGEIKSVRGKLARTVGQFTPHSWTKFEWHSTKSFRNFVAVILLLALELQCELNAFYLKYLLWVPVSHMLNLYRLLFMFFMCLPAVREAYQYLTDPKCKRLGMHAWITTANIVTELLIIIKFSEGEFTKPAPVYVVVGWIVFGVALVAYAVWRFGIPWLKGESSVLPSPVRTQPPPSVLSGGDGKDE